MKERGKINKNSIATHECRWINSFLQRYNYDIELKQLPGNHARSHKVSENEICFAIHWRFIHLNYHTVNDDTEHNYDHMTTHYRWGEHG